MQAIFLTRVRKHGLRTKLALNFIPSQVLPTSIFQDKYFGLLVCLSCKNFKFDLQNKCFSTNAIETDVVAETMQCRPHLNVLEHWNTAQCYTCVFHHWSFTASVHWVTFFFSQCNQQLQNKIKYYFQIGDGQSTCFHQISFMEVCLFLQTC